jgi:hypothetical protein
MRITRSDKACLQRYRSVFNSLLGQQRTSASTTCQNQGGEEMHSQGERRSIKVGVGEAIKAHDQSRWV